MTARSYIKNNFNRKIRNKLLVGIGSYLRHVKNISHEEYKIDDLVEDFEKDTLANQKGIGLVTLQRLESQLKVDGYL